MFKAIRRHWKLGAVGMSCLAIGAGASVIASAGAATSGTSTTPSATGHRTGLAGRRGLRARRLIARSVHGDLVVATRTGFATITLDRGKVQSVSGQQLTLVEGTKSSTYKTVTLTIPTNARVRDNRVKATLADVKPGQRATVIQAPRGTLVIARNAPAS